MSNPRKRQPDDDQQFDSSELGSDQRISIRQQELAQRGPTPEDEYFFNQERESSAAEKQGKAERARLQAVRSRPIEKPSDGIFGRFYRALIRHSDLKWRP